MRHWFTFIAVICLLIIIQQLIHEETSQVTVSDDRPRRRTAKDHSIRFFSKDVKTTCSIYEFAIIKLKIRLSLKVYAIKLNFLSSTELFKDYFSSQCSVYNRKIPTSSQLVLIQNSQDLVDKIIKKLPASKRMKASEIRTKWMDTCLAYGNQLTAISRDHAKEWNELIDNWLTSQRVYDGQKKGFDKRHQLLIHFLSQKELLLNKSKILRLSRKHNKEIHCLTPPEIPENDVVYAPIYSHFNHLQSKMFGNTQYFMSKYLDKVSSQLPSNPSRLKLKLDVISNHFKALENVIQGIWEDTPKKTFPSNNVPNYMRLFIYIITSIWEWIIHFFKERLDNSNEEQKKQISSGHLLFL